MPYIPQDDRFAYDASISHIVDVLVDEYGGAAPGSLNYIITKLIVDLLARVGADYHKYNTVIGVLECCKQELYRRHVGPYEDKAIERNGDVA